MICNHCGKDVAGGTYINGVFYCPMCTSIINKNNSYHQINVKDFSSIPESCRYCPNHPSNGGSGICFCTLGQFEVR